VSRAIQIPAASASTMANAMMVVVDRRDSLVASKAIRSRVSAADSASSRRRASVSRI
jgi:hypothetical protein